MTAQFGESQILMQARHYQALNQLEAQWQADRAAAASGAIPICGPAWNPTWPGGTHGPRRPAALDLRWLHLYQRLAQSIFLLPANLAVMTPVVDTILLKAQWLGFVLL